MGISLYNAQQNHRDSRRHWGAAQLLALLHGWSPEGTYYDHDGSSKWMGYYYNQNSGQRVSEQDAANLGDALLRARESLVFEAEQLAQLDLMAFPWPAVMDDDPPEEEDRREAWLLYLGSTGREALTDLGEFCRSGTFFIC